MSNCDVFCQNTSINTRRITHRTRPHQSDQPPEFIGPVVPKDKLIFQPHSLSSVLETAVTKLLYCAVYSTSRRPVRSRNCRQGDAGDKNVIKNGQTDGDRHTRTHITTHNQARTAWLLMPSAAKSWRRHKK